jgi:four helix bundle protein
MEGYRKLLVWQRAMQFVPIVYRVARQLPVEERYALSDQLRRAAVSIPANIAEGQARQHRREFIQALSVARGSLAEVDTLLRVAVSLGYATEADIQPALMLGLSVRQLLQRLLHHLRTAPREVTQ